MIPFPTIVERLAAALSAGSAINDPMLTGEIDPVVIDPKALEDELAGTTPEAILDDDVHDEDF